MAGQRKQTTWTPFRAAGKRLGGAVSLLFTGRRRKVVKGRTRRARSLATAFTSNEGGHVALSEDRALAMINGEDDCLSFPSHMSCNGRDQGLLAVGHKLWGNWWDGRGLLKVRIYDFALYADREQVYQVASQPPALPVSHQQQQGLRLRGGGAGGWRTAGDLFQHVNRSHKVDMSLQLRAARNLPVWQLAAEFDSILQRRSEKVGGSKDDPAIQELVHYFSTLPPAALLGDAVRRGSVITFARSAEGQLHTMADGVTLGKVQSPKLCEALFDLYLGDPPVCRNAKVAGDTSLLRMASGTLVPFSARATDVAPPVAEGAASTMDITDWSSAALQLAV